MIFIMSLSYSTDIALKDFNKTSGEFLRVRI